MDEDTRVTKEGVKLFGKLVVAAAEDDSVTAVRLARAAPERVRAAALFTATKLVAEEVPLVRVAQLLGSAEDYEGTVGE